jgi:hypothetical protein
MCCFFVAREKGERIQCTPSPVVRVTPIFLLQGINLQYLIATWQTIYGVDLRAWRSRNG